ncbi:MAG TPA: hypothetical protein P5186_21330 [Candidatus Paceibacterota bacterium]|nr:hypothetical protein [Verrucomicrobiota bacterium]HRY50601.1 hypothetical protein [Candidatus Paceibacterota bacterium]
MAIQVRGVESPGDLKRYLRLPFQLYRDDPNWVPPLWFQEKEFYDPRRNPNLAANPYRLLLANRNGTLVGRMMVLINRRANEYRHEKLARWTFLDVADDPEAVTALLHEAETWGRSQGMDRVCGPRGFSDQEPQGMLVEGFEERSPIATHYNRPYLPRYLEAAGYVKEVDWICYRMPVPRELPASIVAMGRRLRDKANFHCHNFRTKAELKPYLIPVLELLNETYDDLYGFAPTTADEFRGLAEKYLPLLDPRFVHLIENSGELVAFSVVMPDLTEGLQKARGRLFPFGFFHILRAGRRSRTLQFLLVGIRKAYRNKGLFALFAEALLKEVHAAGMTEVHSHLQLEHNTHINRWLERLGGTVVRRYRAYLKAL